ncbi:MAG: hypothetical protein GXP49_10020 [Deltaproteobacteria bacterium]|nr:hypothetical protein [Deltaproteobacteria bacterium]
MDNLLQGIGELTRDIQKLAQEAMRQYSVEVEATQGAAVISLQERLNSAEPFAFRD